jgi:hypothetical protein
MNIAHFATHYPEILRKIVRYAHTARGPYAVAALTHAFRLDSDCKRHVKFHVRNLLEVKRIKYTVHSHAFVRYQATGSYAIQKYDITVRTYKREYTVYFENYGRIWVVSGRWGVTVAIDNCKVISTNVERVYVDWTAGRVNIHTVLKIYRVRRSVHAILTAYMSSIMDLLQLGRIVAV